MKGPPLPPGLLIGAPASGSGKTTVALGLMAALAERGRTVQPFKAGPDYIDPAFHAVACGRPSFNLDSWAMDEGSLAALAGAAAGADLCLAEGAMGLFDGVATPGLAGNGASADLAALFGWPVLLVLDAAGAAQTLGAVALGLARFRPDVRVAGVILNRVASPRHGRLARQGLEAAGLPVLGALPRAPDITLPERHLGLVQAVETEALATRLRRLGRWIAEHVNIDAVPRLAASHGMIAGGRGLGIEPPGQRIALARDAAFSFVYPHLLSRWREAGATVLTFSPLADEPPPRDADVVWLPGGYPELHAGRIASATRFLDGLRQAAERVPIHGECGGFMVLGARLTDAEGVSHPMAGLLGLETSFATRSLHLGYRHARLAAAMPGFPAGAILAGHEFHYSTVAAQPDAPLAVVTDAEGRPVAETGGRRGRVTGSFFHLIGRVA